MYMEVYGRMKLKSKKAFKDKNHCHHCEHIIMDFSIDDEKNIILSNALSSFLSIKSNSDLNTFKSLFLSSNQEQLEKVFKLKKTSTILVELLEHKLCRLSFNYAKQTGYMIYLPEVSHLKNELKNSKDIIKRQESSIYQMAHELKTPLSSISSYLELLKLKDLDPDALQFVNQIEKAYDQGLYQMNSILELSKLNYQNRTLNMNKINVKLLFEDLYHIFKATMDNKGLLFHITHQKEFTFESDSSIIKQILTNLISNAIKFTDHGSISIETSLITIDKTNKLHISITDTGIGMTDQEQLHIFDSFSQANHDISDLYGGTGLGLSISQKLLSLLNGSIKIKSQFKVGTSFILEIPVKLVDISIKKIRPSQSFDKPKPGLSILIVEDNKLSADATFNLLKAIGLHAVIASSGREAVQKFLEYPFDLILMDISLPIMDGFETAHKIREKDLDIPILGMTANTYHDQYVKCIDAKMNDVLYKPFKSQDLYHIIAKYSI